MTSIKTMIQLRAAIDRLPLEDKEAYIEALDRVPNVVDEESSPTRFLRVEQFDAEAAARRLVTYWRLRKELFGDRAFGSLKISALNEEELTFLSTGATVQLPNDVDGRAVLCNDLARVDLRTTQIRDTRRQCLLYWLTKISMENTTSQSDGLIFLRLISTDKFDPKGFKQSLSLVQEGMPVKFRAFHLCCVPPSEELRSHFLKRIVPAIVQLLGKDFQDRVKIHVGKSTRDVLGMLKKHHLKKTNLPPALGGTWSYQKFDTWLEHEAVGRNEVFGKSHSQDDDFKPAPAVTNNLAGQKPPPRSCTQVELSEPASVAEVQNVKTVAQDGVHGSSGVTNDDVAAQVLQKLQFFLSSVAPDEKADLIAALAQAPHLVESESAPLAYLRAFDYQVEQAGRALILYWKLRCSIFGDRAFLDMNLHGEGAMPVDGVRMMASGFLVQIPDSNGRPTLFCDMPRLEGRFSGEELKPESCLFYFLTKISMEEKAYEKGVVFIRFVNSAIVDPGNIEQSLGLMVEAMPLKINSIHMCCMVAADSRRYFESGVVPTLVQALERSFGRCVLVHTATSGDEMVTRLKHCGFKKDGLPNCIGGDWSYNRFNEWIVQQCSTRSVARPVLSPAAAKSKQGLPKKRKNVKAAGRNDVEPDPLACLAFAAANVVKEEDRRAKKRVTDAVYARERRSREKNEVHALQRECVQLSHEQMALEAECLRLQSLLKDAMDVISNEERNSVMARLEIAQSIALTCPTQHNFQERASTAVPDLNLQARNILYGRNDLLGSTPPGATTTESSNLALSIDLSRLTRERQTRQADTGSAFLQPNQLLQALTTAASLSHATASPQNMLTAAGNAMEITPPDAILAGLRGARCTNHLFAVH